jgi:hypothetical protein
MEALIKIHPEAIKTLVNSSWEFANNNLFSKYLLDDDEKDFIKNCIRQYYWSIPADKFCEISGQYFSSFCWKILHVKSNFDNSKGWKTLVSPALTSWNNSIHANEFFTKENFK